MDYETIKAGLNLYAVLKNLEELVIYDSEMALLAKDWDVSIQFSVANGPKSCICFKNGTCTVIRGKHNRPDIKLFFFSPKHLNKMFDGKSNPVPLKGFSRIGFLTKEFPKLTDKMEHYLKPTDELLKNPDYLTLNTRMTLNTAVFAIKELAENDPVGKVVASRIRDGNLLMKILPDGPSAFLEFCAGRIKPGKGDVEKPMACMYMKDMTVANNFLNDKIDAFTAIATGDVIIKGQTPMLDNVSLILDRIPLYLT